MELSFFEPRENIVAIVRSGAVIAHSKSFVGLLGEMPHVAATEVWGPFGVGGGHGSSTAASFFPGAFRPFNRHGFISGEWITVDKWHPPPATTGPCGSGPFHPGLDYWWQCPRQHGPESFNIPRCTSCGWRGDIGTWWPSDLSGERILYRCCICTSLAQWSVWLRQHPLSAVTRWNFHQQLDATLALAVSSANDTADGDYTRYFNDLSAARGIPGPDEYWGPDSEGGTRGTPIVASWTAHAG